MKLLVWKDRGAAAAKRGAAEAGLVEQSDRRTKSCASREGLVGAMQTIVMVALTLLRASCLEDLWGKVLAR
jgi:hypothetical protein